MSSILPISQILQIASVCEYIAVVQNAKNNALEGGNVTSTLPRLIYMERMAVQHRYNLNPSDPALPGAANYLFSILWYQSLAQTVINNLGGSLPVITGPTSQSVNVGQTATFSVSVASSTNVTYQWFLNGVAIPGATSSSYPIANAQLNQSGGLYSVSATNSAGTVTSNQATLTVTQSLQGFFYQGATDYSTLLEAGSDTVPYLGTFPITTGQPFTVTFPDLVATEYVVVKYPATEPTKTSYLNPPPSGPDGGPIPNLPLNETTFGGWKYIFSRTGNTMGVNGVNGQIKFS
jgi:Immunoglobulin domain